MVLAAGTAVFAAFFFLGKMIRMKPELRTDDEIREFSEKSRTISEAEFDALYDLVIAYLKTQGSFSGGGLEEADFSSSRWVDPRSTLIVVANVAVTPTLAEGLWRELSALNQSYAVVFDGIDGVSCVTSDGRFLKSAR